MSITITFARMAFPPLTMSWDFRTSGSYATRGAKGGKLGLIRLGPGDTPRYSVRVRQVGACGYPAIGGRVLLMPALEKLGNGRIDGHFD